MIEFIFLYATPLLARAALGPYPETADVFRTLAPLAVTLVTTFLPRYITDLEWEHVTRHAIYTLGFAVSIASTLRWDNIFALMGYGVEWVDAILAYAVLGIITLAFFTIAHVAENYRVLNIHTHHGDIAVLPLTLVAATVLAGAVPPEAFVWSRSIIFYVPIMVGWATLNFTGHLNFATSSTTTHHITGFSHIARAAIVVASAHLTLIELEASMTTLQYFPLVASLLFIQMPAATEAPPPISWRVHLLTLAWAAVVGMGLGGVLLWCGATWHEEMKILHSMEVAMVVLYVCVFASTTVPLVTCTGPGYLCIRQWVAPATAFASLLTSAYLPASSVSVRVVLVIGYSLAFITVSTGVRSTCALVASPTLHTR